MTNGSGPWGPQVARVLADLGTVEGGMDRSRASAALAAAAVGDWSDHLAATGEQRVHIGQLYADLDSLTDLVDLVASVAERLDLGPGAWDPTPAEQRGWEAIEGPVLDFYGHLETLRERSQEVARALRANEP
ncbi:hypothetical protein [Nocardiopsis alba]|uniref:hypothetical protein n=1 Tax=Nocardiopsis alba TaxID=53437 RepID=UPI00362FB700